MSFDLTGHTALVTGASQGIGEGIARCLAGAGARVVLAARSEDKLQNLAEELRSAGAEAHVLPLDLGDAEAIPERIKTIPEPFNGVDILINNAGVTADNLLARLKLPDWQRVIDVNLTGTYAVTRAIARGMIRKRWGRIVTVSSVVGLMGNPGQSNYAAAKAGLIGMSKSLAREFASRSITVNVVAPGYIDTAMSGEISDKMKETLETGIPLKRIGTVEDIASSVLYLASEEASYVTGHVLSVNGGMYM